MTSKDELLGIMQRALTAYEHTYMAHYDSDPQALAEAKLAREAIEFIELARTLSFPALPATVPRGVREAIVKMCSYTTPLGVTYAEYREWKVTIENWFAELGY